LGLCIGLKISHIKPGCQPELVEGGSQKKVSTGST